MHTIQIDLSPEAYKRLEEQARKANQPPEKLGRELLETALQAHAISSSRTTREVLQAAGRVRALSATLRSKIIPGTTLDEVRTALTRAAGPSLSDLIREQRNQQL
jgi:hypothetical protein